MRGKKLLAAFLLGVGLCFVPAVGYGEVKKLNFKEYWYGARTISNIDWYLLEARVNYMMRNPTNFLDISFAYDPFGVYGDQGKTFPKGIDTKDKIVVWIKDNRRLFSDKSGIALLDQFKKTLENIYTFIRFTTTDMDTVIVAEFESREGIPLGYFYQGEYHLWEK